MAGWLPIFEIKHANFKNQKIKIYIQASSYVILSPSLIFSTSLTFPEINQYFCLFFLPAIRSSLDFFSSKTHKIIIVAYG